MKMKDDRKIRWQGGAPAEPIDGAVFKVDRRRFLHSTLSSAVACGFAQRSFANSVDQASSASTDAIIDTHVYIGRWPFRQVSLDGPAGIVAQLRKNSISQAWAGTFDGLLHKDIGSANERLVDTCRAVAGDFLIPFGTVNPTLPDWEKDVRRCHEVFHMPGIRLHPNYHGYTLDDPRFARLLMLAAERKLVVQIVGWLDDELHPYLQNLKLQVSLAPLVAASRGIGGLRLILANAIRTFKHEDRLLHDLAELPGVTADFGRMADAAGVNGLVRIFKADRIVLGSAAPLNNIEPVVIAVQGSALGDGEKQTILADNARKLLQMSPLHSE